MAAERLELYKRPSVDTITRKRMRRKITNETWEQIKTGYAAGVPLRELARRMNIPEGTVLYHAMRYGWTQQIKAATHPQPVPQSDTIAPLKNTIAPVQSVQSVSLSVAAILAERKERTKLGLSKYVTEAAEQAGEHPDKLGIAGKVKDVASVHGTLWPEETHTELIDGAILIGMAEVVDAPEEVLMLQEDETRMREREKLQLPAKP